MIKKTLAISNKLGLHARASMKLVDTASRFQASVTMHIGGQKVDAKDMLQTMSVGANKGTEIEFIVDGPNENESMQAIEQLLNDKFGEGE